MSSRIIFYYQTFNGIADLIENPICTHIHVSSIHFGTNKDGSLYIHLNDNTPSDKIFDKMWNEIEEISKKGVKIVLMVGGAGDAYQDLFSNFEAYYSMLRCTIIDRPFISGIDLDIEENASIDNIKMLINRIVKDFGSDFIISSAPVQYSLETDNPGMGGFDYKQLYNSPEGSHIDYFNGQFYGDYSVEAYDKCIKNGYPANKIVMGMTSSMYNQSDQNKMIDTIKELKKKYPNFGGVFDWEEFNSYPNSVGWLNDMKQALEQNNVINHKWYFPINFLFN
jgi:hypothetical protein